MGAIGAAGPTATTGTTGAAMSASASAGAVAAAVTGAAITASSGARTRAPRAALDRRRLGGAEVAAARGPVLHGRGCGVGIHRRWRVGLGVGGGVARAWLIAIPAIAPVAAVAGTRTALAALRVFAPR